MKNLLNISTYKKKLLHIELFTFNDQDRKL